MNDTHDDAIEALLRKQFDGPVADDGFSGRVMQQVPRRRRVAWPLWAGVATGMGACWCSLSSSPWLLAGWRNGMDGELSSVPLITLLLVIVGMTLLAGCWVMAEADDR